jgi:hypothetical protein
MGRPKGPTAPTRTAVVGLSSRQDRLVPEDASLYILPYSPATDRGAFIGIVRSVPRSTWTLDFSAEPYGPNPKVSIHESGRVHAAIDGHRTPPLLGARLDASGGGHIATITCFDHRGLPIFTDQPQPAPELHVVLRDPPGACFAVHMPIYVSTGLADLDKWNCQLRVKFQRPTLECPLFVGVRIRGSGESGDPGVLVMAGWGPGLGDESATQFVYAATGRRDA